MGWRKILSADARNEHNFRGAWLAAAGVAMTLGTDSQSVMGTSLQGEYDNVRRILMAFRSGLSSDKVRVIRDVYLRSRGTNSAAAAGPFEVTYAQLPSDVQRNIDNAYEGIVRISGRR